MREDGRELCVERLAETMQQQHTLIKHNSAIYRLKQGELCDIYTIVKVKHQQKFI